MSEDPEENTGGQPVRTPRANDPLTVTRLARRGTQVAAVALTVLATIFLLKYDKDAKSAAYQAGQCAGVAAVVMWSRVIGMAGQVAQAESVLGLGMQVIALRKQVTALQQQLTAAERHVHARFDGVDAMEVKTVSGFNAVLGLAENDIDSHRNGNGRRA